VNLSAEAGSMVVVFVAAGAVSLFVLVASRLLADFVRSIDQDSQRHL